MSNCPVSHVRMHTHKQTAAWILSKLLDTSCLRALTRNKPHVQLLETSVSTTVAARLGKTKHACNHWLWKSSTEIRRPFLRTTCAKTIFDLKRLLLPNAWQPRKRKPRTTIFKNQQPSKKNAQDWFPKWAPKWDPKRGPKLEPNWGHASCFLLTEPKTGPQNGGPKWIQKRAPKRIQNGPQKQPQERI